MRWLLFKFFCFMVHAFQTCYTADEKAKKEMELIVRQEIELTERIRLEDVVGIPGCYDENDTNSCCAQQSIIAQEEEREGCLACKEKD